MQLKPVDGRVRPARRFLFGRVYSIGQFFKSEALGRQHGFRHPLAIGGAHLHLHHLQNLFAEYGGILRLHAMVVYAAFGFVSAPAAVAVNFGHAFVVGCDHGVAHQSDFCAFAFLQLGQAFLEESVHS